MGNWLDDTLKRIPEAQVAVFGDFCIDAYWSIDADESEVSVETGLPVRRVREQRYGLGGAGNVVANLLDLGVGCVRVVGLVGDDLFGRQMREMLAGVGADVGGLLTARNWQTQVYAKPYVGEDEQNRIDFGSFDALADETADALAERLDAAAGACDVVILNQQIPAGVSPPPMIERINAVVAGRGDCRFLVDSRHRAERYRGCILKLNAHEAARLDGEPRPLDERIPAETARRLARQIHERTGRTVFLTRGRWGLVVAENAQIHDVPGIQVLDPIDPVGAGDTATGALAGVLATGGDALTAARLANIAASITVRKLQTTGTATPAEICAVGPTPDYVYLPELADDIRRARYAEDSEIEVVWGRQGEAALRHALFDHDGTLSTLRQGWERIMEPMMVHAILGPRYADADAALYHKVLDTVREFIAKTTGIQTLVQMQGLVELVRRFGCVPTDDVLDLHGYKALYNEELLAMVRRRLDKLRRGELDAADFQIKGAREMLEALGARGVSLYLVSGTDTADVKAEAETLGYAHLFEGRIYGAVGDVRVEAKRAVLARIFADHALGGAEVAVFGDGPVEVRAARKRGAVAVGVASDEVRRFGLSSIKRSRLIRAGADLVIPDFSQRDRLLAALGVNG